ncbi:hypothetical protein SAMD00019534_100440 [Acytostelium subglobosum LB1]|uniref:hypothetical protein n=1 Tax=Acytostelium subglobosum LB1 TaxID=1410327 RepID=UPI000644B37E|nr:hypothetical protein SAMD00019534_100440 [Acytostelium subglobosum LB1]GAM26869.1 hypothetical protein SAMD00019534_100440 [Acytostelium subglobosum LB1]|eukprot:XP_012750137.1 hypothetical protein SAMD00019534_100440 [Acytostelium subglobosum LB1]
MPGAKYGRSKIDVYNYTDVRKVCEKTSIMYALMPEGKERTATIHDFKINFSMKNKGRYVIATCQVADKECSVKISTFSQGDVNAKNFNDAMEAQRVRQQAHQKQMMQQQRYQQDMMYNNARIQAANAQANFYNNLNQQLDDDYDYED